MTPDPNPFPRMSILSGPRITIVSGRTLLFVAALFLMAYALFLTWGESPRDPVPTMTPQTTCCVTVFNGGQP